LTNSAVIPLPKTVCNYLATSSASSALKLSKLAFKSLIAFAALLA